MIALQNRSNRQVKPGQLVKIVRGGFALAATGDTPIGVLTTAFGLSGMWRIEDSGKLKVFIEHAVVADEEVRMPIEGEGGRAGYARAVGDATEYISIGRTTEGGSGLVEVALNIISHIGKGSSGIITSHYDLEASSIGVTVHSDIDIHILDTSTNPHGVTSEQILPSQAGNFGRVLITDGSTVSWAATSFYGGWDLLTMGVTRETITSEFELDFIGDTTYIQVQYNTTDNRLEFSYVGPTTFYEGWDLWTEMTDTTRVITSGMSVDFSGGTFLDVAHTFASGIDPMNRIVIDIDQIAFNNIYYTKATADAEFYSQTWINSNTDDYDYWNFEYGPSMYKAISSGNSLRILGGTDIGTSWDGASNTITINYSGSPGTMDDWYFVVDGGANHTIANHGTVDFQAGTGISLTYTFVSGVHGVKIDSTITNYWTADTYGITYANNVGIGVASSVSRHFYVKAADGEVGIMMIQGGNVSVTAIGEINSQLDFGSNDGSVAGEVGARIAAVTEAPNGAHNGLAFYTFTQTSPLLTEKVRITNTGRVGIGNTSPSYTFDVSGSFRTTGEAYINALLTCSSSIIVDTYFRSSDSSVVLGTVSAGTVFLRPDGYLTTTNQSSFTTALATINTPLTVNGGLTINEGNVHIFSTVETDTRLTFQMASATVAQIYFYDTGDSTFQDLRIGGGASDKGVYWDSSVERVGINDDTPSYTLDVNGTGRFVNNLYSNAEITSYASDRRLKCNIIPISSALEALNKIDGVTYNWNKEVTERVGFKPARDKESGFIAQDLLKILPEAVTAAPFDIDGDGNSVSGENYLTVKPERLIPLMVEAIKELNKEIEQLKAKMG